MPLSLWVIVPITVFHSVLFVNNLLVLFGLLFTIYMTRARQLQITPNWQNLQKKIEKNRFLKKRRITAFLPFFLNLLQDNYVFYKYRIFYNN